MLGHFSRVQLFVTLWIVTHQAPPSMGLSRHEYWSVLPHPPPGDLPHPETELTSACISCIAAGFFTHWVTWEAQFQIHQSLIICVNFMWTVMLLNIELTSVFSSAKLNNIHPNLTHKSVLKSKWDYVFVNISLNYYGANISTISMFSLKITLTFNPVSNRKCGFISLYVNQNLSHIFLYIIMADLNKRIFQLTFSQDFPKLKKLLGV